MRSQASSSESAATFPQRAQHTPPPPLRQPETKPWTPQNVVTDRPLIHRPLHQRGIGMRLEPAYVLAVEAPHVHERCVERVAAGAEGAVVVAEHEHDVGALVV